MPGMYLALFMCGQEMDYPGYARVPVTRSDFHRDPLDTKWWSNVNTIAFPPFTETGFVRWPPDTVVFFDAPEGGRRLLAVSLLEVSFKPEAGITPSMAPKQFRVPSLPAPVL